MAKKYLSEHTQTRHTYQFYKQRRNDPEWTAEFEAVQKLHRRTIIVRSVLGVLIVAILAVGAYLFHQSTMNQPVTATSSSSSSSLPDSTNSSATHKQFSSSQKTSMQSSASQSSISNAQQAMKYLPNRSYSIMPTLYNGEDIDQAMDEGKAPANAVHDNVETVQFIDGHTASVKYLMAVSASTVTYNTDDLNITIKDKTFPYTISNGTVTFGTCTVTDSDGAKITYEIQPAE